MRAEILSIGTELLLGSITDTNASYLAQRLAADGIDCYYISQVGDNLQRLTDALRRAWERSDLVITTGGLGPTQDDLTREAIAALLGEEMRVVPRLEAELRENFARRHAEMPATNLKQASLVASAEAIPNPVGTAPGWWVTHRQGDHMKQIVSMPGVPFEMYRMWESEVEPRLQAQSGVIIVSRVLKVLGYGESAVEARVADLMAGSNPTLAPYAKPDGIHLRITAKAKSRAEAEPMISSLDREIRGRLGNAVYGVDDETPWGIAAGLLRARALTIVLLEVGPAAAGSLAPLATEAGTEGDTGVLKACASVSRPAEVRLVAGATASGDVTLKDALEALKRHTGADVALGVQVSTEPVEGRAGGSVIAKGTTAVLGVGPNGSVERAGQTWKTASGEVKRLAGLAACNMLRLALLQGYGLE